MGRHAMFLVLVCCCTACEPPSTTSPSMQRIFEAPVLDAGVETAVTATDSTPPQPVMPSGDPDAAPATVEQAEGPPAAPPMQTAEVVPDDPANGAQDTGSWACPTGAGAVTVGADSLADPATCLIWQATSPGAHSNREATLFCETLEQDGFADWRVPRPEELASHPSLAPASNAYITNPVYLRGEAQDPATGCAADAHSCNLSHYSQGNLGCAWQGVGFKGPLLCVRGDALVDSLPLAFAAASCTPCSAPVGSNFNVADCRTP